MLRVNVSSSILPAVWIMVFIAFLVVAAPRNAHGGPHSNAPVVEPGVQRLGGTNFEGSTIVSNPMGFLPDLIYRKYPTDAPVEPGVAWQLSFRVRLEGAPASVNAALSLDPQAPDPNIQILQGDAIFVEEDGLHHNYDPAERFQLLYTGTENPFLGAVDLLVEPEGFPALAVRVHLRAIDQSSFPLAIVPFGSAAAPLGDVNGDGQLEIIAGGLAVGVQGLFAFTHAGVLVPGWPLHSDDPDIVDQIFSTPAVVDLDADGPEEVVVVGYIIRNPDKSRSPSGTVVTQTLYAVEGSGTVRWQITDDFEQIATPAVGDLDGDGDLDIVVGAGGNLKRFEADGTPSGGWQVATLNDIHVEIPVIADVDGDPENRLEIIACTPVFGLPPSSQVYVWNQDGTLHHPAWPKELETCLAPAVLDLDGNPTNGLEIVMAIDHADPEVDPDTGFLNTFTVFAWHADGSDVAGWPHHFQRDPDGGAFDDRIVSSCSGGDVDGNGDMEIVVGTYGLGDPAQGNLFLFHHDGTLDGNWPRWAGIAQTPSHWGGVALGDLDGDNRLEIVTGSFLGVYVFQADGEPFGDFPRLTAEHFFQPMIADLEGDGSLEIVTMTLGNRLYAWDLVSPAPDPRPWALFRQNTGNTGTPERAAFGSVPTLSEAGMIVMLAGLAALGAWIIAHHHRRQSEPEAQARDETTHLPT